jgi:peptide deformylase
MNPVLTGSVRQVRVLPDAVLKAACEPVTELTPAVIVHIADLIATLRSLPRCVGLAAPQLGLSARIVVFDVTGHSKAPAHAHGLVVAVNPVLRARAGRLVTREGCVSVPELTANVERAARVALDYLDLEGKPRALEAEGFEAVVIQHELDHLDGVLFLDRVRADDVFKRKSFGAVNVRNSA